MEEGSEQPVESLLPYHRWIANALRHVAVQALEHAAAHGLPGAHHFYVTFRTSYPGVSIPPRLMAQYPEEMTIVLQHQFWDLKVDQAAGVMSVGLSFGGVPSILRIPFDALVAFADPAIRYALRFEPVEPAERSSPLATVREPEGSGPKADETGAGTAGAGETGGDKTGTDEAEGAEAKPTVVNLDAFRRRAPPKS